MKYIFRGFLVILLILSLPVAFADDGNTLIRYQSHITDIGWQDPVQNGSTSGTTGQSKKIEAFRVEAPDLASLGGSSEIQYQAYCSYIGWQDPVSNGNQAGTTGENRGVEAIRVNLVGTASQYYDVYYRVHTTNIGWLGWTMNNEIAGTTDLTLPIEALEIKLVHKGEGAPGSTENSYLNRQILYDKVQLLTEVSFENLSWQPPFEDGNSIGTEGSKQGIEALKMNITNLGGDSSISYNLFIENIGWQGTHSNGDMAGTENQNLQAEAIMIDISGPVGNLFDVYYQTECEDQGWLGWTCNGGVSGTSNGNKKIEAIRVALVLEGDPTPQSDIEPYREIQTRISANQVPNFNLICAIVQHEGGDSYDSALAVMSCVMNRCDSGRWGGSDPVSVLTAPGQFSSYSGGYYKQFLNNPSPVVQQAVLDCLNGKRNHPYQSFRSYPTSGSVNIGGNWFF